MQNRGLQVVDVHLALDDVVVDVFRRAIDEAALAPSSRHPDRERVRVMVAHNEIQDERRAGSVGLPARGNAPVTAINVAETRADRAPQRRCF